MTNERPAALAAGLRNFVLLSQDGRAFETASARDVFTKTADIPVLICNRALLKARLGNRMPKTTLDILELFAFVRPAVPCIPTTREIAAFLGLPAPVNAYEEAQALFRITHVLLKQAASFCAEERQAALPLAAAMTQSGGWIWGYDVLTALGADPDAMGLSGLTGFAVWERLPEWTESAPEEPPGSQPVSDSETVDRLAQLLSRAPGGTIPAPGAPENRAEQIAYAKTAAKAFNPRKDAGIPVAVLAEAGTGVGKTLGYVSPASVWCDKNAGSVWISTYTRNLQKQLDNELTRLYPDPQVKRRSVVIRKGRENYLCLLNYAEAVGRISANPALAVPLGLTARWISRTGDGDLNGGDFPGWLTDLLGQRGVAALADRRGECVYGQCPHFRKCFIEKIMRRSRHAKIVVANHALVMTQLAGCTEDTVLPVRYVFDEGHQLFNAADTIFSAEISGMEGVEMRRWLLGAEDARSGSRTRGLKRRIEDLTLLNPDIAALTEEVADTARFLPRSGVLSRLKNHTPQGVFEQFLMQLYRQVLARSEKSDAFHSLECAPRPVDDDLKAAAVRLYGDVKLLEAKAGALAALIDRHLDKEAANMETADKQRCFSVLRSLRKVIVEPLSVWRVMLEQLETKTPPDFVDWLEISRTDGIDADVGYHRHWIDPTFPFAHVLSNTAHGVLVTSATLKDKSGDSAKDWANAARRTGLAHFRMPGLPFELTEDSIPSPFDYAANARVFILTDVDKNSADQVAAACRELFIAAQGGGLGIFTAIARLRAVYARIREPLAEAGLPLLAQHVDTVNMSTLLDVFKAEEDACLLGTDAVRDGIDVPGRSLRLLLFDRVPWPRPDIAHRARKEAYGGAREEYNLMIVRMKMAQAFGRLIRKKDDRGVFVMLDRAVPSETLTAFPEGTPVEKVGLKEAVRRIKEFLS